MRHGKKRKLSTADVDRALKWYKAGPAFGHGDQDRDVAFVGIPDVNNADGVIFAPDDDTIDLVDFGLTEDNDEDVSDFLPFKSDPSVQATWLMLDGNAMEDPDQMLKTVDAPNPNSLTPALAQYYSTVTSIVLNESTSPEVLVSREMLLYVSFQIDCFSVDLAGRLERQFQDCHDFATPGQLHSKRDATAL